MSIDFKHPDITKYMLKGQFGLEKECLRVTPEGYLAQTKHPFGDNPNIDRDFCESQLEFITDVKDSAKEAWEQLLCLQKEVSKKLRQRPSGKELMWPFSNPPYLTGEKDIPIADYKGKLKEKTIYREYLAEKYGKTKMLFSGIHFNFSFSGQLLEESFKKSKSSNQREHTDSIYLELAKKVTRYSWLIVYLTAASPVFDGSFFDEKEKGKTVIKNYSSPRCGKMGYWNDFIPVLKYDTLDAYVDSIEAYIKQGLLKEAAELYYPVRLKPSGKNSLDRLKEKGIEHIELRMLDLNPLDPAGICVKDLQFIQLLFIYLMSLEDEEFQPFEQIMAIKNEKRAALFKESDIQIETGWSISFSVKYMALHILLSMEKYFADFEEPELIEIIRYQERKILDAKNRYAVQIRDRFREDYVKKGIRLAEKYLEDWGK